MFIASYINFGYLCKLLHCEMDNKQLLLIINPISGTGNKRGLTELVEKRMSPLGYKTHVKFTTGRGDATQFAREAIDNRFSAVLAAGGDGTINETATALCDSKVALGIIPAGSGNGLARHLNIPIDPVASLNIIAENNIVDCDYCSVNGRPFFCTFGIGFDATVSEKFAQQGKRGKFMYVKSAFEEYLKYHSQVYSITANGVTLTEKAFLIACCNASQYGNNAYIAPSASITDGMMDITIVHSGNLLDNTKIGLDLFSGYLNRNTLIHTIRTSSAVITRTEAGPAHLDGEPMSMPERMEVKCHHKALPIFVPAKESPFKPIITPANSMWNEFKIAVTNIFRRK